MKSRSVYFPRAVHIIAKTEQGNLAPCLYAVSFKVFADKVIAALEDATHSVHVNRAKLLLTDQYFRQKRILPATHQDTSTYNGHPCVYHVFCEAYEAIDHLALRIVPPAFEVPPRPPVRSKKKNVEPLPEEWNEELMHRAIYADS